MHIKNYSKHFDGVYAVNGVSMEFAPGKITGIIGPNGSGKSTLINCLTGIVEKNSGHILGDHSYSRTFQDSKLWLHTSIYDSLLVARQGSGLFKNLFSLTGKKTRQDVDTLLEEINMYSDRAKNCKDLSYGQRKIVEIARAIIAVNRKVLYLDEPFSGLSEEKISIVKNLIAKEIEAGKSVVIIEHDMDIIRLLCDKVYVLDAGKCIAEGTAEQVLENVAVKEAYLGL